MDPVTAVTMVTEATAEGGFMSTSAIILIGGALIPIVAQYIIIPIAKMIIFKKEDIAAGMEKKAAKLNDKAAKLKSPK